MRSTSTRLASLTMLKLNVPSDVHLQRRRGPPLLGVTSVGAASSAGRGLVDGSDAVARPRSGRRRTGRASWWRSSTFTSLGCGLAVPGFAGLGCFRPDRLTGINGRCGQKRRPAVLVHLRMRDSSNFGSVILEVATLGRRDARTWYDPNPRSKIRNVPFTGHHASSGIVATSSGSRAGCPLARR